MPAFPWIRRRRVKLKALAAAALFLAAPAFAAPKEGPATIESLAGRLLVAGPRMPDPRFAETVIFMVRHDETGALGVVVNRPVGRMPYAELLKALKLESEGVSGTATVHEGGPVERYLGFVLHSADVTLEGSWRVGTAYAFTADPALLSALGRGTGPKRALFAFGYAGWGPGQLEGEMARDDWLVIPADDAIVFDDAYTTKWKRAIDKRGIDL
jgi:putative transcriptional regulator